MGFDRGFFEVAVAALGVVPVEGDGLVDATEGHTGLVGLGRLQVVVEVW